MVHRLHFIVTLRSGFFFFLEVFVADDEPVRIIHCAPLSELEPALEQEPRHSIIVQDVLNVLLLEQACERELKLRILPNAARTESRLFAL